MIDKTVQKNNNNVSVSMNVNIFLEALLNAYSLQYPE